MIIMYLRDFEELTKDKVVECLISYERLISGKRNLINNNFYIDNVILVKNFDFKEKCKKYIYNGDNYMYLIIAEFNSNTLDINKKVLVYVHRYDIS